MYDIVKCQKCPLYKNQKPLVNFQNDCDIMWIGLSAKKIDDIDEGIPLSPITKSGKILQIIETSFSFLKTYKTNLVKCLPLDIEGKLRYPSKSEIDACVPHIEAEIKWLKPKLVILLGEKVSTAVLDYYNLIDEKNSDIYEYKSILHNNIWYISVQHPSYIAVYKRHDIMQYAAGIHNVVTSIFSY